MGCHALHQGIFPTPAGIEPTSLTSPALAGKFFTTSTTSETHSLCIRSSELQMGTTVIPGQKTFPYLLTKDLPKLLFLKYPIRTRKRFFKNIYKIPPIKGKILSFGLDIRFTLQLITWWRAGSRCSLGSWLRDGCEGSSVGAGVSVSSPQPPLHLPWS